MISPPRAMFQCVPLMGRRAIEEPDGHASWLADESRQAPLPPSRGGVPACSHVSTQIDFLFVVRAPIRD